MGRPISMKLGTRFGKLVVVSQAISQVVGQTKWLCACDCGQTKEVYATHLKSGGTSSCGCGWREAQQRAKTTHGLSRSPTYISWQSMIARCHNSADPSFPAYGAAGIIVCDRWRRGDADRGGFECFLADMGLRPNGLTIERRDRTKGYEPGNCTWATRKQQAQNRSTNVYLTHEGVSLPAAEWARQTGVHKQTLSLRLKRGWTTAQALGFDPPPKKE